MDKIELEKLFSVAISREIEAHEFYLTVAGRVENEAVKQTFVELAREEMGHKELLEEFKNNPQKMMKITPPPTDFKVAEATELPSLTINMKPADAIALAMKKEEEAVKFYRNLGTSCMDEQTCAIFENLANMELTHKNKLENAFVEIGYPEVF